MLTFPKRTYAHLPKVKVEGLAINQKDLDTKRMLDLMAVNTEDGSMPLYLHAITRILRDMRTKQQHSKFAASFNYAEFKREVEACAMTAAQLAPLKQRLDTLESFMPSSQTQLTSTISKANVTGGNDWTLKVCRTQWLSPSATN